jgi:hypothetical protein
VRNGGHGSQKPLYIISATHRAKAQIAAYCTSEDPGCAWLVAVIRLNHEVHDVAGGDLTEFNRAGTEAIDQKLAHHKRRICG